MCKVIKYFYKGILSDLYLEYDTQNEEWLWLWNDDSDWYHYIWNTEPRRFLKKYGIK